MEEREAEAECRVTVRFPRKDFEFIQGLVDEGEFTNSAEVIREAVKRFRAEWSTERSASVREERALLAFKQDIENASIREYFAAHTSFLPPLHRFEGTLTLLEDTLIFRGRDKKDGESKVFPIMFEHITDVRLGFDDTFRRRDDRSLGLFLEPLRIAYRDDGTEQVAYFFVGFSRFLRTTRNKEWHGLLKGRLLK